MAKSIQLCKHGVVIREFPCEFYSLNLMNGIPAILDKEDRSVTCIPSPNTYDYIEINEVGGESE